MGFVLLVTALALLAAFTTAAVSVSSLRLASRATSMAVAENLAESVVQEALALIQEDFGFQDSIELPGGPGLPAGSRGILTFQRNLGVPFSTNNFLGDSRQGWERQLPDQTIHLLGVGEAAGVRRTVEVVLHIPSFPVAMACDGPVTVKNSLISSFTTDDEDDGGRPWTPGSGFDLSEEDLGPGHLISNSELSEACVLDPRTRVTGDVQAFGGVRVNGARIEGEVRSPWSQKAPLPRFDLERFDPKINENTHYESLTAPGAHLSLIGNVRHQGDLIVSGSIELDNAFLYVDGDLVVRGPLRGVGAVAVLGKVSFEGAVNLESNEQVAVLSGGGISLSGDHPDRSLFQGLLYTKGPFEASKVTVLGGFMVDDGASTVIEDCNILYSNVNINPRYRKMVYAVVPRFYVPGGEGLQRDEEGYATGVEPSNRPRAPIRHVSNVLDLEHEQFLRSNWDQDDMGAISVHWVNEQPVYRYHWVGRIGSGGMDDPSSAAYVFRTYSSAEALAEEMALINTGGVPALLDIDNLKGTPPNQQAYRQYLLQVIQHLEQPPYTDIDVNYQLTPNEFLMNADRPRILYRRVF